MNKKVKKLWVEALRSGKYQQARIVLKRNDSFCCLGVLCNLHRKIVSHKKWEIVPGMFRFSYAGEERTLPKTVILWSGLKCSDPFIETERLSLAEMNDSKKYDFNKIADAIEKEL